MANPKLHPWILASRPKTLAAAVAPVMVGAAVAYSAGGFRALPASVDPSMAPGLLEREAWEGSAGTEMARAVAAAPQPALGFAGADGRREIWRLDPSAGPTDLPPAASELAVVLLHRTLLPAWGYGPGSATDGTVVYRSDPDHLWRMVASGETACGFFLPPMSAAGFAAAIADGDVLPPKSTRFMPKVVSGLVWAEHQADLA